MASTVNIYMSIRSSKILYCIHITINQKLGSKRYPCHCNCTSRCRNCTAGCKITCCTTTLCTVTVCSQCKVSKVSSLTGRTGIWRCIGCIWRCIFGWCVLKTLIWIIRRVSGLYIVFLIFFLYNNLRTCRAAGRFCSILIRVISVIIRCCILRTGTAVCIALFCICLLYTSPSPRD